MWLIVLDGSEVGRKKYEVTIREAYYKKRDTELSPYLYLMLYVLLLI